MKKLILLLSVVFFTSCSKDNKEDTPVTDQLPAITTTGANTAGCIINGKVLIPKNGIPSFAGTPYGLKLQAGNNFNAPIIGNDYWQLTIANNKDSNNNFGLVLWLKNMSNGIGDYTINQSNGELNDNGPLSNQIIAGIKTNGINKTYWSGANSGIIKVTRFDFLNGIYSGIFSGILYNKDNPSETINITDGRFDINVATLNN